MCWKKSTEAPGHATLVSDGLEDGGRSVRLFGSGWLRKLPVVIFVSPSAKKYDVSNAVETPKELVLVGRSAFFGQITFRSSSRLSLATCWAWPVRCSS